jgi:hypothetical protein
MRAAIVGSGKATGGASVAEGLRGVGPVEQAQASAVAGRQA